MKFKEYLLNEDKDYLGQKAGDILSAIQSLGEDAPQMGARAVVRAAEGIVNQIRRILHGRWDEKDLKYLKKLQKIGVALMKGIDSDGDLEEIVASAQHELENVLDDMGTPINTLGSEEEMPPAGDNDEGGETQ